eukprot:scaffold122_cov88-Cylindrotheca_fusiformis.AAC.4
MYNETFEYIKRRYPETVIWDPEGPPTNDVEQRRLEERRKGQKTQVATCRTRVADLERELHIAKQELEEAYENCRPLQGEYYRLAKAPDTIIKVEQVHEGVTNKSAVRKYDQLASQLDEFPIWDIPDEKVGFFVKRYTDPEATLPQEVDEYGDASSSSDEDYEEPPKKKKAKRVLAARCSTGAPIRKKGNVDS